MDIGESGPQLRAFRCTGPDSLPCLPPRCHSHAVCGQTGVCVLPACVSIRLWPSSRVRISHVDTNGRTCPQARGHLPVEVTRLAI